MRGGAKVKQKVIMLLGAVAAVVLCAVLAMTFLKKDKLTPPEEYVLGEERTAALEVPEETEVKADGLPKEKDEKKKKDDEEEEEEPEEPTLPEDITYTYLGLTDTGDLVQTYVESQIEADAEAGGFTVLDDGFAEVDLPDFTAAEGSVLLGREATMEKYLFLLRLSWSEEECEAVLSLMPGSMEVEPTVGLGMMEALDFFTSFTPSQLQLEGSSMAEYEVYLLSGAAMVDGHPCMKMEVCKGTDVETNETVGLYLVSSDGSHIYRLPPGGTQVIELDLPDRG